MTFTRARSDTIVVGDCRAMNPIQMPNIFAPASTPAFTIRELSFVVLAITAAIFLIVGGFTLLIPYLGLGMCQSLPLAAILTFSDRVIYRGYSSLDDQALAGVIMWVPGSFPLLLPILRLIVELSTSRVEIVRSHG